MGEKICRDIPSAIAIELSNPKHPFSFFEFALASTVLECRPFPGDALMILLTIWAPSNLLLHSTRIYRRCNAHRRRSITRQRHQFNGGIAENSFWRRRSKFKGLGHDVIFGDT